LFKQAHSREIAARSNRIKGFVDYEQIVIFEVVDLALKTVKNHQSKPSRLARSADFRVCRIADFLVGEAQKCKLSAEFQQVCRAVVSRGRRLKACDTAGKNACATARVQRTEANGQRRVNWDRILRHTVRGADGAARRPFILIYHVPQPSAGSIPLDIRLLALFSVLTTLQ
jgi:hypothetical protein